MGKVTYADEVNDVRPPLTIRLQEYIVRKGYALADSAGSACKRPSGELRSVGILKKPIFLPEILTLLGYTRDFIGVISLDDVTHKDGTWRFEVFGQKHVTEMRLLATQLAKAFDVNITVVLVSTESKSEFFLADII